MRYAARPLALLTPMLLLGCAPDASTSAATPPQGITAQTTSAANTLGTVVSITPDELSNWLAQGDTVLVDVREPHEFAAQHIPGAINRPLSSFDPNAIVQLANGKRYVLHCMAGHRSGIASNRMAATGGTIVHFDDGINGWKASGRTVVIAPK